MGLGGTGSLLGPLAGRAWGQAGFHQADAPASAVAPSSARFQISRLKRRHGRRSGWVAQPYPSEDFGRGVFEFWHLWGRRLALSSTSRDLESGPGPEGRRLVAATGRRATVSESSPDSI
jgi:hypothetical protein